MNGLTPEQQNELRRRIAVMQAALEDKPIQWRHPHCESWHRTPEGQFPLWNWAQFDYRVAECET